MADPTDGYSKIDTIDLPGTVGGHGDIVAFDAATNKVWLSQSPDNNEVVIDPKNNTVEATIPDIGDANGVAFSPKYAFVADVTNDTTDVINKRTFQVVDRVAQTGSTPDGVAYVPSTNQVTVASDDANVLDFIDAKAPFTETSSTQLLPNPSPPGPDVQLYVPQTDRIYQPDDQQLDVINPHTGAITKTFPVLTTGNVKPLVYDPAKNDLIVGTTTNELLVVNATSGKVETTVPVTGSVDEGVVDRATHTAFFASSAGVVDAVNLKTDKLVGTIPTEAGTHTLTVDPRNNDLYVYEGNSNTVDVFSRKQVVCFAEGTFIRTVNGDVAVEDLVVGDLAVTASGARRPIRWLGHRTIDCHRHACPHEVYPIRVAAHAFGEGRPSRDLYLSPGHPVLIGADEDNEGGHLVPIMCLVNGTSIERVAVDEVTYWHVELDAHDILLAENLAAESYLDWGDRGFFTEAAEHALADPDFIVPGLAGRCRPVAIDGTVVDAERRRLDTVFAMRLAAMSRWPTKAGLSLGF